MNYPPEKEAIIPLSSHHLADWFCERYRCWMSKATCDSRRKKAAQAYNSNLNVYRQAGCHTCKQEVSMSKEISSTAIKPFPGTVVYAGHQITPENSNTQIIPTTKSTEDPAMDKFKKCPRCKQMLPITSFNLCKSAPNGLKSYCKVCDREKQVEFRKRKKMGEVSNKAKKNGIAERVKPMKTILPEFEASPQAFPESAFPDLPKIQVPIQPGTGFLTGASSAAEAIASAVFVGRNPLEAYFSEHPDMYAVLVEEARADFRTPINQALYTLHKELVRISGVHG